MKGKTMNWKHTAIATATALSLIGLTAYAHGSFQPVHGYGGMMGGYSQAYGMGPGMMGGYGGNYGGGYGMGPGMMGGYGGGYGMGPGTMGGYGGGYGMGPGMMGGDPIGAIERLDLSVEQRQQISKIESDLRKKNWALMGEMHDEMDSLYERSSTSGKPDRDAVLAANKRMSELRQQMLENSLDATDKAQALLTPQQREQYQHLARDWRDGERN